MWVFTTFHSLQRRNIQRIRLIGRHKGQAAKKREKKEMEGDLFTSISTLASQVYSYQATDTTVL